MKSSQSYVLEDMGSFEFPQIRKSFQPKRSTKPIVFNVGDTQYDVVERVG